MRYIITDYPVINTSLVYFTGFEACHIFPITIPKYKNNYTIDNSITNTHCWVWRKNQFRPKQNITIIEYLHIFQSPHFSN